MIEKFNFYDIYGYFLPGAAVLLLLWLPIGLAQHRWPSGDLTSALLGAVLAYIAGILLQTFADKALPSTIGKAGEGAEAYDRYPSERLLDPYNPAITGKQLSDTIKNALPTAIEDKFGIDGDTLAVNQSADKGQDLTRRDAFFLARHYLVLAKGATYTEQFEGMYALTRGLAAALGLAAFYYAGWAVSSTEASWAPAAAYFSVTCGILIAVCVTGFLIVSKKRSLAVEWIGALGLLLAALGTGLGLGYRFAASSTLAFALVICALVALLGSLRAYRFYREFIEEFAVTVWRDFFVASKKTDATITQEASGGDKKS